MNSDCDDDDSDDASHASITVIPETSSEDVEEERDLDTDMHIVNQPEITHSIVFKCIGCTKESNYQETVSCRTVSGNW